MNVDLNHVRGRSPPGHLEDNIELHSLRILGRREVRTAIYDVYFKLLD